MTTPLATAVAAYGDAEDRVHIESLRALAAAARAVAAGHGLRQPDAVYLDDSDQGPGLVPLSLAYATPDGGLDESDDDDANDAFQDDDAAYLAASNVGVQAAADLAGHFPPGPGSYQTPVAVSLARIDALVTDPRPEHAAALVDPMLAATDHESRHDGPAWEDVRRYVDGNADLTAPDNDTAPRALNTRRAALTLGLMLSAPDFDARTPAEHLGDLLTDLRHAADALGLDYADIDAAAERRYTDEAVRGEA